MKNIKNFVVISHIDHGKSTLADRFLELTETIPKEKMRTQYLDAMDLEQERGITIKMHPVRMVYRSLQIPNSKSQIPNSPSHQNLVWEQESQIPNSKFQTEFILNLIDTPGHVDFSYEVSRALACVEGAVLLVDATQGIQAQTLANLDLAKKQKLKIIPVVNKIDLFQAKVEETVQELADLLGIDKKEIIKISAKLGTNVEQVLEAVIKEIPAPAGNLNLPFRALIFDSKYDQYKGVIAYVRVMDGEIKNGEKIYLLATKTQGIAKEIGYFRPELSPQKILFSGEIGYIATGIKEPGKVRVGDTITSFSVSQSFSSSVEPLPGYKEPQPVVFASFYPENPDDFDLLKKSLEQLKLTDPSFVFNPESKEGLGRGFQCGFLGSLHSEIILERLKREFNLSLVISASSVVYKVISQDNKESFIYSAQDFPQAGKFKEIQEPWAKLEIISPDRFLGRVFEILEKLEGRHKETRHFGKNRTLFIYEVPLREIIIGFYDNLKNSTEGYGSLNYEILEFRSANLVKLEVLIAGKKEEAFSKIVSSKKVYSEGKALVEKLKEVLPAQQFAVPLQAVVSGKIIARETIKARRKDVTGYLYGGDYTRKRKLLERQKKGKRELAQKGRICIPPKVFFEIFKAK